MLLNILLEVTVRTIRQEKEIKEVQIGKEEVKLSLYADNMILYIGDPPPQKKYSTERLMELIKVFDKVARYKVSTWKSIAFVYTENDMTHEESLR